MRVNLSGIELQRVLVSVKATILLFQNAAIVNADHLSFLPILLQSIVKLKMKIQQK